MMDADALADQISAVVSQWLAQQGGGMLTAFAFIGNYYDEDGEESWVTAHTDRQTPATTLGLLRHHTLYIEAGLTGFFRDLEEDD